MPEILSPLRLLLAALAGWMNDHHRGVVEYLLEENRILREQLHGRRLRFSDDQRRRLAEKAVRVGKDWLARICSIVSPETLLAWHRRLVASKSTAERKAPGRPPIDAAVQDLIRKIADENPSWGYDRIRGALSNLGHDVAAATIANALKAAGTRPSPERKRRTTWSTFVHSVRLSPRPGARRVMTTAAQRAEILKSYARSGLGPRGFAERTGLLEKTLSRWIWRHAGMWRVALRETLNASKVRVQVFDPAAASSGPFELQLSSGLILRVDPLEHGLEVALDVVLGHAEGRVAHRACSKW